MTCHCSVALIRPQRAIHVIPNFVDSSRFRPGRDEEARSRFALPGERILLHISNFRPVKRVTDVIRIFAAVQREMPAKLRPAAGYPPQMPLVRPPSTTSAWPVTHAASSEAR